MRFHFVREGWTNSSREGSLFEVFQANLRPAGPSSLLFEVGGEKDAWYIYSTDLMPVAQNLEFCLIGRNTKDPSKPRTDWIQATYEFWWNYIACHLRRDHDRNHKMIKEFFYNSKLRLSKVLLKLKMNTFLVNLVNNTERKTLTADKDK